MPPSLRPVRRMVPEMTVRHHGIRYYSMVPGQRAQYGRQRAEIGLRIEIATREPPGITRQDELLLRHTYDW